MTYKSLNDPFNPDISLKHETSCECPLCVSAKQAPASGVMNDRQNQDGLEKAVFTSEVSQQESSLYANAKVDLDNQADNDLLDSPDDIMDRAIESAVVRSVFGHNEMSRSSFLGLIAGGTAAAPCHNAGDSQATANT